MNEPIWTTVNECQGVGELVSEEGWGPPLTLTQSGSFIWKNMGDEKAEVMSTFQGFKGFNLYTLNSPPFLVKHLKINDLFQESWINNR